MQILNTNLLSIKSWQTTAKWLRYEANDAPAHDARPAHQKSPILAQKYQPRPIIAVSGQWQLGSPNMLLWSHFPSLHRLFYHGQCNIFVGWGLLPHWLLLARGELEGRVVLSKRNHILPIWITTHRWSLRAFISFHTNVYPASVSLFLKISKSCRLPLSSVTYVRNDRLWEKRRTWNVNFAVRWVHDSTSSYPSLKFAGTVWLFFLFFRNSPRNLKYW
jgi:hypothetical protein